MMSNWNLIVHRLSKRSKDRDKSSIHRDKSSEDCCPRRPLGRAQGGMRVGHVPGAAMLQSPGVKLLVHLESLTNHPKPERIKPSKVDRNALARPLDDGIQRPIRAPITQSLATLPLLPTRVLCMNSLKEGGWEEKPKSERAAGADGRCGAAGNGHHKPDQQASCLLQSARASERS